MVSLAVFLTACSKRSTANHELRTANLVYNCNFELGATTPDGWHTYNQFLSDITGWATDEFHSGKHSLKIENIGGSNAYWIGNPIVLNTPIQGFSASVWTKAKNVKDSKGDFSLVVDLYDKNGNIGRNISLNLPKENHDWQQTSGKAIFPENIVKIIPRICYNNNLGTVWIDDMSIHPVNLELTQNVLFDSNKNGILLNNSDGSIIKSTLNNNEENVYNIPSNQPIVSSILVPINKFKVYKLSGNFKSLGNYKLSFGVIPYTKDQKFINNNQSVNYVNGTDTKLVMPCNSADTVVYVSDGTNWTEGENKCIAFNTDPTGSYNDLPNISLSELGIKKISKLKNYWSIELIKPVGNKYPRGTRIREHQLKSRYIYCVANGITIPLVNTQCSALICALEDDVMSTQILYPKTEYVRIVIRAFGSGADNETIKVKNISFEEIGYHSTP